MKNYIKKYRTLDERNLQTVKQNIATLQNLDAYPKKFNYPITLQFELTGQCNLKCNHCYNRSGGELLLLGDKLFDIMDILHDDGTRSCRRNAKTFRHHRCKNARDA